MRDDVYDFGMILKELRDKLGYTQEYVASYLDMSQAGYSGYENNTRMPSFEKIVKLSWLLKTTTDYLLGRQKKPPIIVDALTDEQIKLVQQIVSVLEKSNRR